MGSRFITIVGVLACCGIAHAQDVPEDPVAVPADPVPDPVPEPPTPTPTPTPAPIVAPTPTLDGHRARRRGRPLVVIGFGFGVAGATGSPSEIYGPAFGFAVELGLALNATSLEARTGIGFSSLPRQAALQGARTRGSYDLRSVIVRRRVLDDDTLGVSVFAGVATASVPLVAIVTDPFGNVGVASMAVTGTGATFGVTAHHRLTGEHLELVGELAGYGMLWELPGAPYVHPMPGATDTATTLTIVPMTDAISSFPWSLTLGLRAEL